MFKLVLVLSSLRCFTVADDINCDQIDLRKFFVQLNSVSKGTDDQVLNLKETVHIFNETASTDLDETNRRIDQLIFAMDTIKRDIKTINTIIATDECASSPCMNNATCIDRVNGYTCNCTDGMKETNCNQVLTSACTQDSDCSAVSNSRCSGTSSKTCTCKPGYKPTSNQLSCSIVLTNFCTQDSECSVVSNSVCSGSSSKTCTCKPGYKTSSDQLSCTVSGTCSGWVQFGNSCYNFLDDMPRTFWDAVDKCSQYNSHVLYVESADENNFLKQQLQKFSVAYWWNGITDEREQGIWRWYGTGEVVTFFDWYKGEPNNWPTEDCCHIGKVFSYQWNDTPCKPPPGYEAYAICEKTVTVLTA